MPQTDCCPGLKKKTNNVAQYVLRGWIFCKQNLKASRTVVFVPSLLKINDGEFCAVFLKKISYLVTTLALMAYIPAGYDFVDIF